MKHKNIYFSGIFTSLMLLTYTSNLWAQETSTNKIETNNSDVDISIYHNIEEMEFDIDRKERKGVNPEALNPCITLDDVDQSITPQKSLESALSCVRVNDYKNAMNMYSLFKALARFDMLRVNDASAHQIYYVMLMNFGEALTKDETQKMIAVSKTFTAGSKTHKEFCAWTKKITPPTHSPQYMVEHGFNAFRGKPSDVKNFNSDWGWETIQTEYMMCQNVTPPEEAE